MSHRRLRIPALSPEPDQHSLRRRNRSRISRTAARAIPPRSNCPRRKKQNVRPPLRKRVAREHHIGSPSTALTAAHSLSLPARRPSPCPTAPPAAPSFAAPFFSCAGSAGSRASVSSSCTLLPASVSPSSAHFLERGKVGAGQRCDMEGRLGRWRWPVGKGAARTA